MQALGYRHQHSNPQVAAIPSRGALAHHGGGALAPRRNPLTTGQWIMVGGAAVFVGGVSYLIVQQVKKRRVEQRQGNPYSYAA